jgi:hypothetical protein
MIKGDIIRQYAREHGIPVTNVHLSKSAIVRQVARGKNIPVFNIRLVPIAEEVKTYQDILKEALRTFEHTVDVTTQMVQKHLVNFFCDEHRCTFWSGMGGYGFKTRSGKDLTDTEWIGKCLEMTVRPRYRRTQAAKDLTEILKILETKGHERDHCTIGCYMNDYPASKE